MTELALEFHDVHKNYGGLRPLRVKRLQVAAGRSLSLVGFDGATAEVFVNLATGATLPDDGDVRVFGTSTASIVDPHAWLESLDRFGIVSERAVLLEGLTTIQNLAMPLTLEIDPIADSVRTAVAALAAEVGIEASELAQPVAALSAESRLRLRLGRALALEPRILLAEHPNANIARGEAPRFAADFARIVESRGIAAVTLTADTTFAAAVAEEVLTLQPASGEGWRRWFAGR
jgi:putative ABC transport system ATP-binding protein